MLIQKRGRSGAPAAPTLIYGGRGVGWLLIHPAARLEGLFSRPPYLTAAVNLTADIPSEPPRGGEQGAGENRLNRKRSFAESRND